MSQVNYLFDEDGKAYLYREGQVIAASHEISDLERLAADSDFGQPNLTGPAPMPSTSGPQNTQTNAPCTQCGGQGCPSCKFSGTMAGAAAHSTMPSNSNTVIASDKKCQYCDDEGCHRCKSDDPTQTDDITEVLKHRGSVYITTPNGLKGKVVNAQKGLWADEVTVRLENGRIAKFDVVPGVEYKFSNEKESDTSPYKDLWNRLDEIPSGTRDSLISRINELRSIQTEAKVLLHTASYIDQETLDEIIVTAGHEIKEATDAIRAIDEAEPFEPLAPYSMNSVEQESMGHGDGSWLDATLSEMIDEAENQDFDQLMNEGPESLVADVDDAIISDAGEVRMVASSFIDSKIATIEEGPRNEFRREFLARVEDLRKKEEASRRVKMAKKASRAVIDGEGDAEGLFW